MKRFLTISFVSAALLILCAASPQAATLFSDDFEGATVGVFPAGWIDVGQVPGAAGNAPNPSAIVLSVTGPLGSPTKAVSIISAFAESQGIYRPIANLPVVGISFDTRVDRYATTSGATFNDWPWDVTLSLVGSADLAFAPAYGAFASSFDGRLGTYVQGYSDGVDEHAVGAIMPTGTWFNVNLVFNRTAGTIKIVVTPSAGGAELVNATRTVPGWDGFGAEPAFNAIAFIEGELSATTLTNLAVFDNVLVAGRRLADHLARMRQRHRRSRRGVRRWCLLHGRLYVRAVVGGVSRFGGRVRPGGELHGLGGELSVRLEEHGGLPSVERCV